MKIERHNKILEIIAKSDIDTQEALLQELIKHGYEVTQATVSRDIRELDLRKTSTANGKTRYCAPAADNYVTVAKHAFILRETMTSVAFAQNLLVIKTYPGMANAAAAAFDALYSNKAVGTIAGDDTVLVIAATTEIAAELCKEVESLSN